MQILKERRRQNRAQVCAMPEGFRQCDVQIVGAECDCDAVIENISSHGLALSLTEGPGDLSRGDRLFIRGCVLNDLIGFLSSCTCLVRWVRGGRCGVQFDRPLEMENDDFCAALDSAWA